MSDAYTAYQEARRAKEHKRQEALAKPGAPIEYRIGDDLVVLTKQPMEWDYAGSPGEVAYGQKFKAKYRVDVNGVHRGWLVSKNGWGACWVLHRLTSERSINHWAERDVMTISPTKREPLTPDQVRQKFADAIPGLVKDRRLGTLEEQDEDASVEKEKKRQRDLAHAAQQETYRLERIASNRSARLDLMTRRDGLRELTERGVLTNFETAIIADVIADFERQIEDRTRRLKNDGDST